MTSSHKVRIKQAALVLGLFMLIETGTAATIILKSSVEAATVVELFTSHGCSSCPPADAWLRKFTKHEDLWKKIIPMAFHVDYWDYLGWKDRFSSSEYSKRQREYRRSGRLRSVYTPGIVVGGKEWRGWFRGGALEISSGQEIGILNARVKPAKEIMARFSPAVKTDMQKLKAHVVVLGFGISSDIGGGENSGHNLTEDFVVLGSSSAATSNEMTWRLPWPKLKENNAQRTAVVVWLSGESDPAPVQAVGGWVN